MPESFSKKLENAFLKGQLCVGIDPHPQLLIEEGMADTVASLELFSFKLLDQLSSVVGIIKPQVSFFERFGSSGFRVLENLLREANERKLFVIVDAKRGDIGSTMEAYGDAWLAKDAPFLADALTVSPFLGLETFDSVLATAVERGKGLFTLCATSNPEAAGIQGAKIGNYSIAQNISKHVAQLNQITALSNSKFGNFGLVIGATVDQKAIGLDVDNNRNTNLTPILAPGFGHQGANLKDAGRLFSDNPASVIASISRSALREGLGNVAKVVHSDLDELSKSLQS